MKAMILNEYGESAKFQSVELSSPTLKSGHVIVKIAATSVNTVDTMIQQMGQDLPFAPNLPAVLGMDFAGTITEISDDVAGFSVGDEVYSCAGGLADLQGSLAEYMVVDAKLIAHKPKSLSMREAASLPLVGITAFEGLQRANAHAGQKVLVHGGVGGVGHVAVQLAKHYGAEVYATVSGEKQAAIVEQYGATAINYKNESVTEYVEKHTNGSGFDVIYDSVGGTNISNSFAAAALNGQVVTTVSLLELDLTPAHLKGLSLHVVFMLIPMLHNHKREEHGIILAELAKITDAGALKPLLDESQFNAEQVGDAYKHLTSGNAIGKVVVSI